MNYEEFKQDFIDEVTERIHEQDPDMRVSENTVNKLNESYDAITITPDGANVGVNLSINKFFDPMRRARALTSWWTERLRPLIALFSTDRTLMSIPSGIMSR